MPAKSEAQQRLMGMALAAKRGEGSYSGKVKELADSMTEKQLKDFAKTKHDGLPEKKAFVIGFIKRASEYGVDESSALELLKNASPGSHIMWDILSDPHHVLRRGNKTDLARYVHAAKHKTPLTTALRKEMADKIHRDKKLKNIGEELSGEYFTKA